LKGVEVAKDFVFPSRVLKRQLDEAQKKLRHVESELLAMKHREEQERKHRAVKKVFY
jgi:hypothetical protein